MKERRPHHPSELEGIQFGRYEVTKRIAVGGMAEIFLARDVGVQGVTRSLVLKCILPAISKEAAFVDLFLDEIRIAARLSHQNIAHVYDFGEISGRYFIVMEYIDGVHVSQLVRSLHPDLMPIEHAVKIAALVAEALYYAHNLVDEDGTPLGIIHRDVSPENVMISRDGQVKLVDFGVARAGDQVHETQVGVLRGKAAYLAPEQCMAKPLDHRVDIFSLGTVLHEMLCGRRLFKRGTDFKTMKAVCSGPIPPPSEVRPAVPQELDHIVLRALSRDRDERYQQADQLSFALERVLQSERLLSNQILLGRFVRVVVGREPLALEGGALGVGLSSSPSPTSESFSGVRQNSEQTAQSSPSPPLHPTPAPTVETILGSSRRRGFSDDNGDQSLDFDLGDAVLDLNAEGWIDEPSATSAELGLTAGSTDSLEADIDMELARLSQDQAVADARSTPPAASRPTPEAPKSNGTDSEDRGGATADARRAEALLSIGGTFGEEDEADTRVYGPGEGPPVRLKRPAFAPAANKETPQPHPEPPEEDEANPAGAGSAEPREPEALEKAPRHLPPHAAPLSMDSELLEEDSEEDKTIVDEPMGLGAPSTIVDSRPPFYRRRSLQIAGLLAGTLAIALFVGMTLAQSRDHDADDVQAASVATGPGPVSDSGPADREGDAGAAGTTPTPVPIPDEPDDSGGEPRRSSTGRLVIEGLEEGDVVVIDDLSIAVDRARQGVSVGAGEHRLRVLRPRYLPWVEQVEVDAGDQASVEVSPVRAGLRWARLSVESTPEAQLFVAGLLLGDTPVSDLVLVPGPHELMLHGEDGVRARRRVVLRRGRSTTIRIPSSAFGPAEELGEGPRLSRAVALRSALARAHTCHVNGDQPCCIEALEDQPHTNPVVTLLIACHQEADELERACEVARSGRGCRSCAQFFRSHCVED